MTEHFIAVNVLIAVFRVQSVDRIVAEPVLHVNRLTVIGLQHPLVLNIALFVVLQQMCNQQKQYQSQINEYDFLTVKQRNIPYCQNATQNMEDMSGSAGI